MKKTINVFDVYTLKNRCKFVFDLFLKRKFSFVR